MFRNVMLKMLAYASVFPQQISSIQEVHKFLAKLAPLDCKIPLVRVGPDADGGYLLPVDLDGLKAVFSPGVGSESGFELYFGNRDIDVFILDASVDMPAVASARFHFTKKFLGTIADKQTETLDGWVSVNTLAQSDLLLQMDIEGSEWEVLLATPLSTIAKFRIITIEFHNLHHIWSKPFLSMAKAVATKLLTNHVPVHLHINNCCGALHFNGVDIPRCVEMTFLARDRVPDLKMIKRAELPHVLDRDCVSENKPVAIPPYWAL
jgi:hypothetical protein